MTKEQTLQRKAARKNKNCYSAMKRRSNSSKKGTCPAGEGYVKGGCASCWKNETCEYCNY